MSSAIVIKDWVKRNERRDVDLAALAFRADGTSCNVSLRNMSYDGCLVEADGGFAIGEKVRLVLPRMGEIKAQIRWATAEGKAGARFVLEEIGPQERHSRMGL